MADRVSPEVRSRNMRNILAKDTGPEKAVKAILASKRFKFELHHKRLPGTPDIFLRRHRLAIFVHGCFWHRHKGCAYATTPKTNIEKWEEKFAANVRRDERVVKSLTNKGWRTLIVWECAIKIAAQHRLLPNALRNAVVSGYIKAQIPRVASRRIKTVKR